MFCVLLTASAGLNGRQGLKGLFANRPVLVWLLARMAWCLPMPASFILALRVRFSAAAGVGVRARRWLRANASIDSVDGVAAGRMSGVNVTGVAIDAESLQRHSVPRRPPYGWSVRVIGMISGQVIRSLSSGEPRRQRLRPIRCRSECAAQISAMQQRIARCRRCEWHYPINWLALLLR